MKSRWFIVLGIVMLAVSGCRGYKSEKPPFHINPNMDFQAKYKAMSRSELPPEGAQAYGNKTDSDDSSRVQVLKKDSNYYQGKNTDGSWVKRAPITVSKEILERGQARFNIYCAVCHDQTGSGQGTVVKRGFTPPPVLWDPRVLAYTDGELFNVITHGIRTMPAYNKQITEKDRWAIVLYLRAIQATHQGSIADVPEALRATLPKPPKLDKPAAVATQDQKTK